MASHSQTIQLFRRIFPNRAVRWLAFAVGWLLIGALSAVNWQILTPVGSVDYSWWMLLRVKVVLWFAWGLLSIGILQLANRFLIDSNHWLRNIFVLLAGSVVAVGVYILLYTVIVTINGRVFWPNAGPLGLLDFVLRNHLTYYYLAYWLTVGVEHAAAYHQQYHEREVQAARLQTELAEAQLTALRYHLQPHFLFNTLHSIVALVRKTDNKSAISMLTGLSDLLRHALVALKRHEVPLAEEIALLNKYVAIENIRFSDRLSITVEVDPTCRDALVPSFLFQPLVENAIRHGIEKRPGAGSISIQGGCENGRLVLRIVDDGVGLQPVPLTHDSGVGLTATRRRLETLYGDRFLLDLSPGRPHGTVVTIHLPLKRVIESDGTESARTA